jgi:hypothetical protein
MDPADYKLLDEGETGPTPTDEAKPPAVSGLDKLAQAAATKDVTPEKAEPPGEQPPQPPVEKEKPPLPPKAPAQKRTVADDDPPLDSRALGDQELTESRARSRSEVQERHEVPRHARQQQPALPTREPGEEG